MTQADRARLQRRTRHVVLHSVAQGAARRGRRHRDRRHRRPRRRRAPRARGALEAPRRAGAHPASTRARRSSPRRSATWSWATCCAAASIRSASAPSARLQARKVAEVARQLGAKAVAHGCTAAGNDQVRFEVALRTLAPDLEILAPIRDRGLLARARGRRRSPRWGFDVPSQRAAYSVNRGLWGCTIGGRETNDTVEPLPEDAWVLTRGAFDQPRAPRSPQDRRSSAASRSSLDGEQLAPVALIERLDALAAPFGIGRGIHLGDTIFGLKGRVAFEAPAATRAHRSRTASSRSSCSPAKQQRLKDLVAASYGDWIHEGQFLEPACRDAEALLLSSQQRVTGEVQVRMRPGFAVRRRRALAALAQGRVARRSTAKPRANGPPRTRAGSRGMQALPGMLHARAARRDDLENRPARQDRFGRRSTAASRARCASRREIPCVEGGVIAVRVLTSKSTYNKLELPSGRFSQVKPGDVIAGALGHRKALFGFSGHLPTVARARRQAQHPEPRRRARDLRQRERRTSASRSSCEVLGQILHFPYLGERIGVPANIAHRRDPARRHARTSRASRSSRSSARA